MTVPELFRTIPMEVGASDAGAYVLVQISIQVLNNNPHAVGFRRRANPDLTSVELADGFHYPFKTFFEALGRLL